jgi:hypothetical protein
VPVAEPTLRLDARDDVHLAQPYLHPLFHFRRYLRPRAPGASAYVVAQSVVVKKINKN